MSFQLAMKAVSPALPSDAHRIVITNPDSEAVPIDTACMAI
jgi:hypothetical protein